MSRNPGLWRPRQRPTNWEGLDPPRKGSLVSATSGVVRHVINENLPSTKVSMPSQDDLGQGQKCSALAMAPDAKEATRTAPHCPSFQQLTVHGHAEHDQGRFSLHHRITVNTVTVSLPAPRTPVLKSQGGHFRRKKSPCRNSTQQHGACQILGW